MTVWDFDSWDAVSSRQIELARDAGALGLLSIALNGQGMIAAWSGDFEVAAALSAEDDAVREATGTLISPYGAMLLTAFRGRDEESSLLADATMEDAVARGEGLGVQLARWATAVVDNGLGRYDQALAAATVASDESAGLFISTWALPEVIEASVRTGQTELGTAALERLAEATSAADTDWARGVEARSRALLSDGEKAEACYQEAIRRLSGTPLRPELARAHLLYGEWLRRQHRRVDARAQLRTAHELLEGIGMEGFAERARRELLATGEKVRKRRDDTRDELTPKRRTSPGSPTTGARTRRSAPSSTSARAPSNGTCGRCSRSSGSFPARTSRARSQVPTAERTRIGPGLRPGIPTGAIPHGQAHADLERRR